MVAVYLAYSRNCSSPFLFESLLQFDVLLLATLSFSKNLAKFKVSCMNISGGTYMWRRCCLTIQVANNSYSSKKIGIIPCKKSCLNFKNGMPKCFQGFDFEGLFLVFQKALQDKYYLMYKGLKKKKNLTLLFKSQIPNWLSI